MTQQFRLIESLFHPVTILSQFSCSVVCVVLKPVQYRRVSESFFRYWECDASHYCSSMVFEREHMLDLMLSGSVLRRTISSRLDDELLGPRNFFNFLLLLLIVERHIVCCLAAHVSDIIPRSASVSENEQATGVITRKSFLPSRGPRCANCPKSCSRKLGERRLGDGKGCWLAQPRRRLPCLS